MYVFNVKYTSLFFLSNNIHVSCELYFQPLPSPAHSCHVNTGDVRILRKNDQNIQVGNLPIKKLAD